MNDRPTPDQLAAILRTVERIESKMQVEGDFVLDWEVVALAAEVTALQLDVERLTLELEHATYVLDSCIWDELELL